MASNLPPVEIVDVGAVACLGVARPDVGLGEIGGVMMSAIPELDAALTAAGIQPAEDLVALYRRLEGSDGSMRLDLRIGRPAEAEPPEGLERFELPSGRAARVVHVGSYDGLAEVTRSLLDWCAGQGLTPHESWEVYHHLEQPDDPSTYRTTVCVRVEGVLRR